MIKYRLLILCLFGIIIGCKSVRFSQKRQSGAEKFDMEKFNHYKVANVATYTRGDGARITLRDFGPYYTEEIKKDVNGPFALRYSFFSGSLKLKASCAFFYNNPVGKSEQYNEQGAMIKETNYDASYGFTINMLIKKMKADFKIDLLTAPNFVSVQRYIDDVTKLPEYAINIPLNDMSFRYIVLNGNSGEVKKDFIGHNIE